MSLFEREQLYIGAIDIAGESIPGSHQERIWSGRRDYFKSYVSDEYDDMDREELQHHLSVIEGQTYWEPVIELVEAALKRKAEAGAL